jgi:spore maturation protein CgeB
MAKWDKTVVAVMLQWDYGQQARGESLEKACFFPALSASVERLEVLWYDALLNDREALQRALQELVDRVRPDLVFFLPLAEEFSPDFLRELSRQTPTFSWFGDDQWRFDSYSARYAPCFSHVSTTDPWSVKKYGAIGIQPILTQWAAQPLAGGVSLPAGDEPYRYDVSFVGGANRYRRWFVRHLASHGVRVACFGAGWDNGRVDFAEMLEIFRTSRINLNISNSVNPDVRFIVGGLRNLVSYLRSPKRVEQIKARNFEIPLAGGFQLSNYVPGLERYLRIGEEVAIYSTPDDCISQVQYYLEEVQEREQIARSGSRRAAHEHTYTHRLAQIFTRIWGSCPPDDTRSSQ